VIARMEKLFMVGPKSAAPTLLFKLQQAGVVQIDSLPADQLSAYQLDPDEETRLRQWEAVAGAATHAAGLLDLEIDDAAAPFPGGPDEAHTAAAAREQRAAALVEKREKLHDEIQLIHQYQEVVAHLAEVLQGLDQSPRMAVIPFLADRPEDLLVARAELKSRLPDRFLFTAAEVGQLIVAVIVTLKAEAEEARGILAHEGLQELPRTGEYAQMDFKTMAARLAQRAQAAPAELDTVQTDLDRERQAAAEQLPGLWLRATDEANRLHTFKAMGSGRYGFGLCG
jgi:V/A-type H+-transporting ATPase subunit I